MNNAYRDLGRIANTQEPRTSALVRGTDGLFYLVITSQGFVVSVNLHTKESKQYTYPENHMGYPFGSTAAKTGKVYIGAGKLFMEFDPAQGEFTYYKCLHPDDIQQEAWTQVEDEDGTIYFGAIPTYLTSFNPKTREFKEFGIIDPTQSYLGTLAIDRAGYLYFTIGTETNYIFAIELKTGKRTEIFREKKHSPGHAEVCRATDGEVYAALEGGDVKFEEYSPKKKWYRLYGGKVLEEKTEPFTNYYTGSGFDVIHCPYEEHPAIISADLVEHELTYVHPDTGETVVIPLEYETIGAECSPLTEGPDGKVYGTTNHPFQLFTYDPKTDTFINHGRRPVVPKAWGNICTYAVQGDILGGCAYCGGHVLHIDTTQPISSDCPDTNPHCIASYEEVLRPRSSAAMPDGKTMVFGGFGAYGVTGGGLIVYDSAARTSRVIPNERVLPAHSVMAIVPLSDHEILCATSIAAPGGGRVIASEAQLFLYDLADETVIYSFAPIPNSQTIAHLKQDDAGIVHGITNEGTYFAYDPVKREVLCTQDLSEHGAPVRDGMKIVPDGTIWGLMTRGIYRIKPGTMLPELVSKPPCGIQCGMAIIDNKIYFGGNRTHLWSYTIEEA